VYIRQKRKTNQKLKKTKRPCQLHLLDTKKRRDLCAKPKRKHSTGKKTDFLNELFLVGCGKRVLLENCFMLFFVLPICGGYGARLLSTNGKMPTKS